MKKLSVIVSCFNEEEVISFFYDEINRIAASMKDLVEFEFLFIDDGSTDNTLVILKSYAQQDVRVRYISFSRNFGKEAAMYAGLSNSTGDYVTLMDADLQDPPKLLPEMFRYIVEDNYDSVATRRVTRKGEPFIRSFFARRFYRIINKMSDIEMVDGARDYRLMTRQVVDEIIAIKEYNRYSKGIFSFVGFKTKWVEYENVDRVAGETKWSFIKLFKYAIDAIICYTTKPLAWASFLGVLSCITSFVFIVFIIAKTLIFGDAVGGWPSTMCVILFMGGVQLFCMGILGQYLAKNYLETKQRPIYIVKESNHD